MADTVEAPPAYTPTDVAFQQQQMTSPAVVGGQINYGFSQPQLPHCNPQNGHFVCQQTSHNVLVAHLSGAKIYAQPPAPYDYTTKAWIACLCCFWPTGLIAIRRASESRDALACGDHAKAHIAAESSRLMVQISWAIGCSIIGVIILVVMINSFS